MSTDTDVNCAQAARASLERNLLERVCAGDIITRSAALYGKRIAVVDGQRQISYAEFDREVNALGHALLALGLKHQDVVAVASRNSIELLLTYFACARAGLICMPLNLALQPQEILFCLSDAKARVLIAEDMLRERLSAVPLQKMLPALQHLYWFGEGQLPPAEDFAELLASGSRKPLEVQVGDRDSVQLLYTSGTTANPKGVLTSHLAVTMAALSNALAHQFSTEPNTLVVLPLFHCGTLNTIAIPSFLGGGKLVLCKAAKTFEPQPFADLLQEHRVEVFILLPMMYAALLADPGCMRRTFPFVRRAIYAMAAMPEALLPKIHGMFPNADVVLGSGQTEFTPATCLQRSEHQWSKAGSWGTPTAMTQVAIMDEDGELLPTGAIGEIVYRGPQCMQGYLNQPKATQESFAHGWLHSGDMGWMDEDAAIWFIDRLKDIIKSGGENVSSLEVERCLLAHPDVAEAAVVGLPHEHWGEAVVAAVLFKDGQSAEESTLLAHCRQRLSSFKVPKKLVVLDEFPRTGSGKVQKHRLRSQLKQTFA